MASVFLSYSRADRPKAQQVAAALEEEGLTVWWDKVLKAGQTYDEVTEGMLRQADVVVVLWSTVSVKSRWVRAEATLGERYSAVVPAMIQEADRPILFELTQTADLIGWDGDRTEHRWTDFVTDLRHAVTRKVAKTAEPARAAQPAASTVAAPSSAGAQGPADDGTIENTFWTSIQSSTDAADFKAYLKRYPAGHYSDLARNRLAVLEARAKTPEPVVAAAYVQAAPTRPAPLALARQRKLSMLALIAGAIVCVLGAGWGVSLLLPADRETPKTVAEATSDPGEQLLAETVDADTGARDDVEALAAPGVEEAVITQAGFVASAPETGTGTSAGTVSETGAETAEETVAGPEALPAGPRRDCETCPQVVTVPGGTFLMGSPDTERGRVGNEGPVRAVTVAPFVMSRSEITYADWDACLADGGCNGYRPGDMGERGDMPAMSISWRDTQAYLAWLSGKAGRTYRLPTEAEWEYAARGGTQTAYWWGDGFDRSRVATGGPRAAASLPENGYGLVGSLGNLREWVEDCYVNNFSAAPADGSAVLTGSCDLRVIRGGAWSDNAATHRAANRARVSQRTRDRKIGFRVVSSDVKP